MSVHSSHLQVTPPESVKQRYRHSITASRLGPGLTKVLVFGGQHEDGGDVIAETATLEFGMSYCNVVCRGVLIAYGHQLKGHSMPNQRKKRTTPSDFHETWSAGRT